MPLIKKGTPNPKRRTRVTALGNGYWARFEGGHGNPRTTIYTTAENRAHVALPLTDEDLRRLFAFAQNNGSL